MIDTYAVMGNPIAHSKSPLIHAEFAKQTHQHLRYSKIEVPLDKLSEYLTLFALEKGKGLNITVPFKQQAFNLVSELSERAQIAKAVNTIKFMENGGLRGDNTDGIGFIRDIINNYKYSLEDKKILILGAGGAARGILQPILMQKPQTLILANRTVATAQEIAHEFKPHGEVGASDLESLVEPFDLVINATSISLQESKFVFNPSILHKSTFCYDLMYGQEATPFLKWAVSNGASTIADGLGMLVEQAAESFYIWRGIAPETKSVIAMLKGQ